MVLRIGDVDDVDWERSCKLTECSNDEVKFSVGEVARVDFVAFAAADRRPRLKLRTPCNEDDNKEEAVVVTVAVVAEELLLPRFVDRQGLFCLVVDVVVASACLRRLPRDWARRRKTPSCSDGFACACDALYRLRLTLRGLLCRDVAVRFRWLLLFSILVRLDSLRVLMLLIF